MFPAIDLRAQGNSRAKPAAGNPPNGAGGAAHLRRRRLQETPKMRSCRCHTKRVPVPDDAKKRRLIGSGMLLA